MRILCLALAFWGSLLAGAAQAAPAESGSDLVRADLIAEPLAVRPGDTVWVGIRLRMKPGWHTYWRNPGDSGLATEAQWTLPEGVTAGAIVWPVPERIPVGPLVNFGYEGETTLLVPVTAGASLNPSRPIPLKADVSWLVCERECVPGEASLSLELPVAPAGSVVEPDPANRDAFASARARLPTPSPWTARATIAPGTLTLSVDAPGLTAQEVRSALFFPYSETLIEHAAPQRVGYEDGRLTLALTRSRLSPEATPADIGGLLVIPGRDRAPGFEVSAPVTAGAGPEPTAASPVGAEDLLWAALLAFAGGLVLNLMPCVFPVLSIKLLALLRPGETAGHLRLHGLSYTAGVLASFLALASVLLAVRAGGAEAGWGFQLQSPAVVASLAFVLFAMGLSLSGVFHLGGSFAGVGDRFARREGLSGSFFTGVLATVVATPCTAPFMGSAVGFALTQPAPVALAVFAALGLGLAAPFLLLTVVPAWRTRLPRPGPWMETLKGFLAFPIYATAAWLLWVLSQQVGPSGLLLALLGVVLVGFGAWTLSLGERGARAGRALGLASFAGAALLVAALATDRAGDAARGRAEAVAGVEPFTQARLDALLAEGRPVFVNMTAAWCVTCLVNERAALSREAVQTAFKAKNVAYLKGDWTNQNPEITRVLARHGRSGVPLYVLHVPGREAIVLPQILTESTVLASLEGVTAPARRAQANASPR